ncbi:MAG: discoidin domain-containing protein [Fibrobacterota bacterium]|nr:MAG: discoidin domain-containing protein [Fibrobacterota bacterium]
MLALSIVNMSILFAVSDSQFRGASIVVDGVKGIVTASSERPSTTGEWSIRNILDGDPKTAWMPDSSDAKPWIEFSFPRKVRIQGVATRNGLHRTLSDQMNARRFLWRASSKTDSVEEVKSSVNSRYRSRDGWDTGQAFHWDGATVASLDDYTVKLFPEFKNSYLFAFDSLRSGTSPIYQGVSPVAVSDIVLLDDSKRGHQCVPRALRILDSRFGLDSVRKWNPPIQNLRQISTWKKNQFDCGECVDVVPMEDRLYHLLNRGARRRDLYDHFFRLKRKAFYPRSPFHVSHEKNGCWRATFPFFYWEGVPGYIESNPVVEGCGDVITMLRVANGIYPERSPEIEYLNSKEQMKTIKEPAHDPDTTSVRIGSQTWMKKNLTKSPVDSTALCWGLTLDQVGKWNKNCEEYGRLYPAKEARRICPEGWRMPSWREWAKLFGYLSQVKEGKINKGFLWFWLMSPGKWYSGEPGMDPLGFSAKYFSRPPIGPYLPAYEYPTFMASDPWGWAKTPWNAMPWVYGIVIDMEHFPKSLNDSFSDIDPKEKPPDIPSDWEPALDYAPVRCLKNE